MSPKLRLNTRPLDLGSIIQSALETVAPAARAKRHLEEIQTQHLSREAIETREEVDWMTIADYWLVIMPEYRSQPLK